jgi:hypothetical protein
VTPVLAAILSLALIATPQDPVRVTADLSASQVEVGMATTLRITIETGGAAPTDIRIPALAAELEVVGTSDFTQTQIAIPGGRTRATRREVTIVPRAPGAYRIPPVTVIVEGRTYRTASLNLIVLAGAPPRTPGGRASAVTSLHMWVNPDTVFVGQQLTVYAEATFAEDTRSRQARPASFDPPSPAGFWVQDIDNPVTVALRVREGRTIETQTFRRILFPLDAGQYTIPPAHLHYEVRRGFLLAPETRRVTSDSARVVVLPLPDGGRPAAFAGAVGRLAIRASVAQERIVIGQEAVLTMEVTGVGHVKALPEPRLPELRDVEVLGPTQESTAETVNGMAAGVKRFQWVIVPQLPGVVTIPPVEYGYFDPELRQYVVVSTDTMRVEAVPFAAADQEDTALRPIRTEPGRDRSAWVRSPIFAALQAVPLLLVFAAAGVRRRRARPPGPWQHHRRIRVELAGLQHTAAPAAQLAELERLLIDAAVNVAGVSAADPVGQLRAQGREEAAAALEALLADVRRIRFSRQHADVSELMQRAAGFTKLIAPRRRWRSARTAVVVLFAGAALTGTYVRGVDGTFEHALALYRAGDHSAASRGFHEYALQHPRDPTGWYNLGTAAWEAGDRGRAVWAWLRTARLAPRDADVRHNLQQAGASATVIRVLPVDRLTTDERLILAAIAWWIAILALGMPKPRRTPSLIAGTGAAGLLVALVLTAALDARRPVLVTPLGHGTTLHAGPSLHDDTLGELAIGAAARVLDRREDWLLVRADADRAGTRDGWVLRAAVAAP